MSGAMWFRLVDTYFSYKAFSRDAYFLQGEGIFVASDAYHHPKYGNIWYLTIPYTIFFEPYWFNFIGVSHADTNRLS